MTAEEIDGRPQLSCIRLCAIGRGAYMRHVCVDIYDDHSQHSPHIRPSGVRPLNYPEHVQKAWGFPYLGRAYES
jgi:hypothetical protein